ncbi:hypothetical protein [Peribacillus frigoritolerans]|uniref:hypothetical protein n=1 Tax=Peribacillus frigoritolerans TaxID=450367 RepID=UPI0023D9C9B5|nr:hypothetical protein [Peribacillus frigoritolerans]MDF1995908.1 hypothetical protein [Peribacillus frigoritolerans]
MAVKRIGPGKARLGRPAGASRGRTACGKRVPGAEINVQIVQAINKRQAKLQ